jgi:hypothetical protein
VTAALVGLARQMQLLVAILKPEPVNFHILQALNPTQQLLCPRESTEGMKPVFSCEFKT